MIDAGAARHAPGRPGRPGGLTPLQRLLGWLLRMGLWALALAIVVLPVGVAHYLLTDTDRLPSQIATAGSLATASELAAWRSAGAALPANAAPVVLCYHDIRPGSSDGYVVSPRLFERQLMALGAAGYRTLTSQEYLAYLAGAPAGPRSVYLTFDDGTEGLYLYADQILARQHMHGASYLISGRVGTHRPYYLTWAEVTMMAGSGRWDFQAHTHDLHTRGPVGAGQTDGSLLTGRAWRPADHRLETDAQHAARVWQDISAQLQDFQRHRLPRPQLFAYPFSDLGSNQDKGTVGATASFIDSTYRAAFTNEASTPAPTSRRSRAGGEIQRIEIFGDTSPVNLLVQVARWTAVAPDGLSPLRDPDRWWDTWTRRVPPAGLFDGRTTKARYVQASYAPFASADWIDYRVAANVEGLVDGENNANITVRVGGSSSLTLRVGYAGLQVVGPAGTLLRSPRLRPSAQHCLRVDVADRETLIVADGNRIATVHSAGGPRATGGLALALRGDRDAVMPRLSGLTVSALAQSR